MAASDNAPLRCGERQRYEIRVQGHLDARWAAELHVLTLTRERDGTTTLRGPPLDQAALHGLLSRLRDLAIPIISMRRVSPGSSQPGEAQDSSADL